MANIKVADHITLDSLSTINLTRRGDDKIKNQEIKHIAFMIKTHDHEWFDKKDYSKRLGYENMDQIIFGETLRGNLITNFNWYMTRLVKFGIIQTEDGGQMISENARLKAQIYELEAKVSDLEAQVLELLSK
mgnify:CR=1 FL=1